MKEEKTTKGEAPPENGEKAPPQTKEEVQKPPKNGGEAPPQIAEAPAPVPAPAAVDGPKRPAQTRKKKKSRQEPQDRVTVHQASELAKKLLRPELDLKTTDVQPFIEQKKYLEDLAAFMKDRASQQKKSGRESKLPTQKRILMYFFCDELHFWGTVLFMLTAGWLGAFLWSLPHFDEWFQDTRVSIRFGFAFSGFLLFVAWLLWLRGLGNRVAKKAHETKV